MIKKPNELNFSNKKFAVIIAGVPGIGKTTLALSSPKPLLIDLDKGVSRVVARYRTDTAEVENYDELVNDLQNTDLSNYETIVIDTGGKLLEMLKPVVIKEDAKNGKRDGNLSLQGYGAIKRKFAQFVSFVKGLNKHLIFIFHATEVQLADDIIGLRIRMEGSSKDEIWDDIDIGGFVEMRGNTRTIGFSNCSRYYAKGTHGINGIYDIPVLENGVKNNFFTNLFNSIQNELQQENVEASKYAEAMQTINDVNICSNLSQINQTFDKIKTMEHHLTSKEELWFALTEKAKSLGFKFNKETKQFE